MDRKMKETKGLIDLLTLREMKEMSELTPMKGVHAINSYMGLLGMSQLDESFLEASLRFYFINQENCFNELAEESWLDKKLYKI